MFKDRLLRGALSGAIAGSGLLASQMIFYYLFHFAKSTWVESLVQLTMDHSLKETMDFIVGVILIFILNGILGGIFVQYVIPKKDGSYLGRALGYSFTTWFFLEAIGSMYHIKTLDIVAWQNIISEWIGIVIFAVILGWLTKKWDKLETKKW